MKVEHIISIILLLVLTGCKEDLDFENPQTLNRTSDIKPKKFLALGDMYTIGTRVDSTASWPKQLVDSLRNRGLDMEEPDILAGRLWTTQELETEIGRTGTRGYDLVTILIGVNDQWYGTDKEVFAESYRNVITHAMQSTLDDVSKIIIISIPDYGYTPFNSKRLEEISADIKKFNSIVKGLADDYGIKYINIVPITQLALNNSSHVHDDGFHYSAIQYSLWVQHMLNTHKFFPNYK